ncbi:hypothetical protein FRACYDRAFT_270650 [Fragilariopsis cylindrus CCMP1102]|uniref:Uncharacterized protein n=1 Tax=Fragilariopsis cylindrus CCMP1102 TaxID=635003 RepID=A0A1E7F0N7_9STRA|nr:hypothetical protein FRACYDRAFT_270650 [Fragilariopsis cylindrus CCMP1102]|eukprot:OEU11644.1 hypothetical protein FRACYDRAFT_270650 [Fragilariopsis cylindrus CCMP1102]
MVSSRISHHSELFSTVSAAVVVDNDYDESSKYSHQKNHPRQRRRQQQTQQQRRLPSFFIIIAVSLLVLLHNSSSPLFLVVKAASTNSAAASAAIIRNSRNGGQNQIRRNIVSERRISFVDKATLLSYFPRGGGAGGVNSFGTTIEDDEDEEQENEDDNANDNNSNDVRTHPEYDKLLAYRMKQQVLLQLRATALSEALVARGLPGIPSLRDVSTLDGKLKPKKVDWDCALSTEEDPKHCLISYEPEVGSKLIVPMELAGDTDKWITLRELNRLRREDPSKVEPMWSDKYAVLSSWFSPQSRYSLLQHVGLKGVFLNTLLEGSTLSVVVGVLLVMGIIICMPVIEYIVGRFLVSGYLWMKWASWARFVHVGLPFKLVIFQIVFGQASKLFAKLVSLAKDNLVKLECKILEETIPLTVGVPTILDEEEEEVVEHLKENDDDDDDDDDE